MYTSIIKIANRAGDSVRHLSIYSAVFAITLLPEVLLAEESKVVSTVNPMGTEQLVRMTLGLLFILALIFFVAWLARRYGGFNRSVGGDIKLLGGLSVGQRERVVVVQVGETQIVVGVAPGRVQALHVLEKNIAVDVATTPSPNFAERLRRAMVNRS